jgi:hypothetical protein
VFEMAAPIQSPAKCEVRLFQTRLTQTKPVLPLLNKDGSQVNDQGRRQCCHTKHKKFPYRPTSDISLLSGQVNIYLFSKALRPSLSPIKLRTGWIVMGSYPGNEAATASGEYFNLIQWWA